MRRQKRKKKCLIFACMRLLQTDMRRHRCRQGPGEGSRQVQPPAHPASCSIPSPGGGHTHTLPASQGETPPAKDLPQGHASRCPSAITLHAQHPASLPVVPGRRRGLGWAGSQRTFPSPPRSLCRRITPEKEQGLPGSTADFFFPHKLRPRRKPAPGKN